MLRGVREFQGAGGAMLDTFSRDFLQAFLNGVIEWHGHAHIETAPDESQPKWFARHFGELNANPAQDALAWFEDYTSRLRELLERFALLSET